MSEMLLAPRAQPALHNNCADLQDNDPKYFEVLPEINSIEE